MKRNLPLFIALTSLILTVACKDEEPEKSPFVGTWIVDAYTFRNMPSGFTGFESREYAAFYGVGEEEYVLTISEDMTYSRTISFLNDPTYGTGSFRETGEWFSEDDNLTLDPTGSGIGLETDFDVISATGADLVLETETVDFLYADTVTEAYYDYVWDLADPESANYDTTLFIQKINEIVKAVTFDLEIDFDLQK